MCSARDNVALPTLGFPIRASAGHWPFSASPRLIAAVHALHRLLVPRHPPCALNILTVIAVICRCKLPTEKSKIFPGKRREALALIPVTLATVQFSRSEKRRARPPLPTDRGQRAPAASRSLKTQQHAVHSAGADCIGTNPHITPRCHHRGEWTSPVGIATRAVPPGPVDIARADRSRRSLPKKGSLERR